MQRRIRRIKTSARKERSSIFASGANLALFLEKLNDALVALARKGAMFTHALNFIKVTLANFKFFRDTEIRGIVRERVLEFTLLVCFALWTLSAREKILKSSRLWDSSALLFFYTRPKRNCREMLQRTFLFTKVIPFDYDFGSFLVLLNKSVTFDCDFVVKCLNL